MIASGKAGPKAKVGGAVRVLLGFVFVVAAIDKVADPNAFASSIASYRLVPDAVALVVATIVPWMELLCGLGLMVGAATRGNALLLALLVAVFTIAVGSAMIRGLDIGCGCFTQDPAVGRVGWRKLLENVILLGAAAFVYVRPSTWCSLGSLRASQDLKPVHDEGSGSPPALP